MIHHFLSMDPSTFPSYYYSLLPGTLGARGGALGAPPVACQPDSGTAPKARRQTLPPSRSDSIGRPIFQLASNGLLVLDSVTVSP